MIDATLRKLREAEFLLRHVVDEGQKAVRNEPQVFGFYLSAFLSAARSATFALQYEEKAKYDKWFPQWFGNLSAEDQNLLKFLKDQRNHEQKRSGADMTVIWEYVPVTQVRTERETHPAYGFHW